MTIPQRPPPPQIPAYKRTIHHNWPPEFVEEWEERAAILEYGAGLNREQAEIAAFEIVAKRKSAANKL